MKPRVKTKPGPSRKLVEAQQKDDGPSAELHALAQHTERQLNVIQRSMRQRLQAEFARGNLTGPQRLVMSVLVRTQGLSLKQLSEAVSRMPELALHPLLEALRHATPTQLRAITKGLNTLTQLMSHTGTPSNDEAFDGLGE
jgi:hypothetical protein